MEPRLSVAQFNEMINSTLSSLGDIAVEGEITQYSLTAKGGVNLVLKDQLQPAILNVSGYAPRIEGINLVNEGMKVVAFGIPNLWSQGGRFSLQIYKILPLGAGALKEAYEKLKAQLKAEGLFDESRKRALPDIVVKAALLTGKDSAAQSDFLKIIKENKVGIELDLYGVQVQGKFAEKEITETLKYVDSKAYDCIFLVRGGGSLEDLITFNSEKVARSIFAMKTPLIVGVGHEKDESIADYVADIRASTPSQAAYYLAMHNLKFIDLQILKSESIAEKLRELNASELNYVRNRYQGVSVKLKLILEQLKGRIARTEYATQSFKSRIMEISQKIQGILRLISSFNPSKVLERGYAIVRSNNKIIKNTKGLMLQDKVTIELANGSFLSKILKINKYGQEITD